MNIRMIMVGVGAMVLAASLPATTSHAVGLKVAPLEYKTTLKKDERQTGVIDISNPSSQTIKVHTSVEAFKQIDNNGGLQFYDDARVAKGIITDLGEFEIGPRQALRMPFVIDAKTLPEGDLYAAIFFTTEPALPRNGVGQLVRVGTILSIVNTTPGPRSAEVTAVSLPFFQLSDTVSGTYRIKNTGSANSGFYPMVTVTALPGGKTRQSESSLVFGGRERSNDVQYPAGYGIHFIEIGYGSSKKGQWVITLAPWMLITTVLVLLIVGIELLLLKRRRKIARQ